MVVAKSAGRVAAEGSLPSLEFLDLSYNQIPNIEALSGLEALCGLKTLVLAGNPMARYWRWGRTTSFASHLEPQQSKVMLIPRTFPQEEGITPPPIPWNVSKETQFVNAFNN